MTSIPRHELEKIPYLDAQNVNGRVLSSVCFYDKDEWHMWIPVEKTLLKIEGKPADGFYFSKDPVAQSDVYLEFLDFMAQRACWPEVVPLWFGIRDDIFNMTASLRKFQVLHEASSTYKLESTRFCVTELEYLFSLCRSVFDLLQELVSKQWNTVKLLAQDQKKKSIPASFSKIVLHDNKLRSVQEISEKYLLPMELAQYYGRHSEFFQILRTFRDRFIHGGSSIDSIYLTERGFAVPKDTEPFCQFEVWNQDHRTANGLCSLRPAIAHIVVKTLEACDDYAHTIQKIIQYPPPLVPGFRFYMTGPTTSELHHLLLVIQECQWWENA